MSFMLAAPSYIGEDLSGWDTGRVENMKEMFKKATTFKGTGLWAWDVSNVQDFSGTFAVCCAMDADLSAWNTSSAVFMREMFLEASTFASDVSSWNTGRVKDMSYMVRCMACGQAFFSS
jgi:surface protein